MNKLFLILLLGAAPLLNAGIIKKPPVKVIDVAYGDLVCSQGDQDIINEIIKTVANEGKLTLLFIESQLRALEAKIAHVHPLKFLATILTEAGGRHPGLRQSLNDLWPDYFKRTGFFKGLSPNLTLEAETGKLSQHIDAFAQELQVMPEEVRPYFERKDWEGLVEHLLRY